jgi:hypothetical protein
MEMVELLVYEDQGRLKEAEELGVQVMETRKRLLGPEYLDTLSSMDNLAFTWKRQGKDSRALQLMEECVQLRLQMLSMNHPYTNSSLAALSFPP